MVAVVGLFVRVTDKFISVGFRNFFAFSILYLFNGGNFLIFTIVVLRISRRLA